MNKLDLGAVSAYAMAVEKGYEGTEEEFAALQAESGNNAVRAEDAADRAQQILDSIPLDFQEVSQGVAALTEDMYKNNATNVLLNHSFKDETTGGVNFTWQGDVCTVKGTATSTTFNSIVETKDSMPYGFVPGETYRIKYSGKAVRMNVYYWSSIADNLVFLTNTYSDAIFTIPDDAFGLIIRLVVSSGAEVDETVSPKIFTDALTNRELKEYADTEISKVYANMNGRISSVIPYYHVDEDGNNHLNLDEITDPGYYVIDTRDIIDSDLPENLSYRATALIVERFNLKGDFSRQTIGSVLSPVDLYYRVRKSSGWSAWKAIGSGNVIKNTNVYENTYNVSCTPNITTDTNGWLQPVDTDTADETGKTDMTPAIMSMLTETGHCRLAEGVFYVSGNIDMPAHSTIEGCGDKTQIRLLASVENGYVIRPTQFCTIKNLGISGAYNTLNTSNFTDEIGNRHGINFYANADGAEGTSNESVRYCTVSNVFIRNFSGSGILLHNTGYNYQECMYVSDSYIGTCHTGINIDYFSEFNKFTNVLMTWCCRACVNNGGNNVFTSCTFHATNAGFVIDNSDGTKNNNSHGMVIGGTFCHIGSNKGSAITLKNAQNGYVFEGCQIHYNSIDIENSYGIVFNGIEFGRGTTGEGGVITIKGGGLVAFNNCVFMNVEADPPVITITDNNAVRFNNCYDSHTGNAVGI